MAKIVLYPMLLFAGCLFAGLYGVVHDQISYTVSPDYFFAFKFNQFGIPNPLRNRAGAALVGWYATWWMGILIGIPVLTTGLILPGWKAYLVGSLKTFAVVAATALAVGLGALLYATYATTDANLPPYWFPLGVADKVAFARVGTMHNFSYLGGFLGILTGTAYLVVRRLRMPRRPGRPGCPPDGETLARRPPGGVS